MSLEKFQLAAVDCFRCERALGPTAVVQAQSVALELEALVEAVQGQAVEPMQVAVMGEPAQAEEAA
jgi:hypothetical protein